MTVKLPPFGSQAGQHLAAFLELERAWRQACFDVQAWEFVISKGIVDLILPPNQIE